MKGLSVIIPCYNEASRGDLLKRLEVLLKYLKENIDKYEIILVNDGSMDSTFTILNTFVNKYSSEAIKIISNEQNVGKGYALVCGFKEATLDFSLMMDADLSTDIKYIKEFYSTITPNDCLCGSRKCKESQVSKRSLMRKFISFCSTACMRILLKLHIKDTQCGFKMFPTKNIQNTLKFCGCYRWLIDLEFLLYIQAQNIKIKEIPVKWTNNLASTLNSKEALISSINELSYILRHKNKIIKFLSKNNI